MLILSRKKDESIIIDDNIEVSIIDIENGRVRIGISAPKDVEILRKELYLEVENMNKTSTINSSSVEGIKELFKRNDGN